MDVPKPHRKGINNIIAIYFVKEVVKTYICKQSNIQSYFLLNLTKYSQLILTMILSGKRIPMIAL